eukprot:gene9203-10163_t
MMNVIDNENEPLKEKGKEIDDDGDHDGDDVRRPSEASVTDYKLLVFEVEDEGIGVSEEARHRLFNPFQQTQRLAGGTGLGLYSLAKRCEAIKGHCGVSGRKDGKSGSCFWFSVPYRPDFELSKGDCISRTLSSLSSDALQNPIAYRLPSSSPLAAYRINVEDEIELAINEFLPKPLTQASFTSLMKEILPAYVPRLQDKEVPELLWLFLNGSIFEPSGISTLICLNGNEPQFGSNDCYFKNE